jgi:hypothetical protein
MNRVLFFLSFFAILFSCEKTDVESHDQFIVGLSFGECIGDCEHFYKLSNGQLFADDCDFCQAPSGIIFQKENISETSKIERIRDLEEQLPEVLLSSNETVFGCPDCGDWGAIHVLLIKEDSQKHYILDNNIEGNPSELRAFALATRETIQFLSN